MANYNNKTCSETSNKICVPVKMPQMSFNDWKLKKVHQKSPEPNESNWNIGNNENYLKDMKNNHDYRNANRKSWMQQKQYNPRFSRIYNSWNKSSKNICCTNNNKNDWIESENNIKCFENGNKDWIEPGYQPLLEQQKFKPPNNINIKKIIDTKLQKNFTLKKNVLEKPSKKTDCPNDTNQKFAKAEQNSVFISISKSPLLNKDQTKTDQKKPKLLPPYIPKPVMPPPMIATTPESKEEKQRLWRAYRQAMKPFKNREFANAKRTIQRLKKKNLSEFSEIELNRWQNAHTIIAEHKSKISQKANVRWIMAENQEIDPTLSKQPQIYVQNPSYNRNHRTLDTSLQNIGDIQNCPTNSKTKNLCPSISMTTKPNSNCLQKRFSDQSCSTNITITNLSNLSESDTKSKFFPNTSVNANGIQKSAEMNWSAYFSNSLNEQSGLNSKDNYLQNGVVVLSLPLNDSESSWSDVSKINTQNFQSSLVNNTSVGAAPNALTEQNSNKNCISAVLPGWSLKTLTDA